MLGRRYRGRILRSLRDPFPLRAIKDYNEDFVTKVRYAAVTKMNSRRVRSGIYPRYLYARKKSIVRVRQKVPGNE